MRFRHSQVRAAAAALLASSLTSLTADLSLAVDRPRRGHRAEFQLLTKSLNFISAAGMRRRNATGRISAVREIRHTVRRTDGGRTSVLGVCYFLYASIYACLARASCMLRGLYVLLALISLYF